ncbi:MAG TPA: hypothetical protein VGS21_01535, partial [Acidimicrobiales bacterium]|nr:hypothetical protein [Acidimicrobiales bacterium]
MSSPQATFRPAGPGDDAARRARARARARARRKARIRRNRLIAALILLAIVYLVALAFSGGSSPAAQHKTTHHHTQIPPPHGSTSPTGPPAVEAGLMPWQMQAPISREVVTAGTSSTDLTIAGGESSSGSSDQGVYTLDVSNGNLSQAGNLAAATHDAAGGSLGGSLFAIGGGDTGVVSSSEVWSGSGTATSSSALPQPRADATGAVIGSTMYVVGGYDGSAMDPDVLSTTDGKTFSVVATLPVPVRYAAVAVVGSDLYVFGGLSSAGSPVDTIQVVDTAHQSAKVVGSLPSPLAGASALVIGGNVFVAGGVTTGVSGGAPAPTGTVLELSSDKTSSSVAMLGAGTLPVPVAYAGAAQAGGVGYIVGGETTGNTVTADVQMIKPNAGFGVAGMPGAGSPYYGDKLLIADRGNNRLLVLDDTGKIVWDYPSTQVPG